jgi:mutator protein MutT
VSVSIVIAGIIRREGHILLSRRPDDVHLPGLWEFPGGKVEPGETHAEALRRELREELGIEADVFDEIFTTVHHYPAKTLELHFYECEITRGEPRAIEVAEFRWVKPADLDQYQFPEADRELLALLMKR